MWRTLSALHRRPNREGNYRRAITNKLEYPDDAGLELPGIYNLATEF
jgi:hypothetical protein